MMRICFPRQSSRYGVGKEIGGTVYVHRRYKYVLGSVVEEARKHLPPDFSYTVVKLTLAKRSVSFVEVADFDTAPEPAIGTIIAVKTDGSCRRMPAGSLGKNQGFLSRNGHVEVVNYYPWRLV